MKRKRILYIIILCIVIVFCTACTKAPPEDCADELVRNQWSVVDSNNKEHGTIFFQNNKVIVNADLSGEKFYMNEDCIVDTQKITVTSDKFGVFSIDYEITGNCLYLKYYGKQISLIKK